MLQNLLMTAVTPLNARTEINSWENQPFLLSWADQQYQNVQVITKTIKKKKRVRTSFSTEQLRALEKTFSTCKYLTTDRRKEIAEVLKIDDKCVKVWFQNRRMKEKRESSESSCDSSNESISPPASTQIQKNNEDNKPECLNHYFSNYRSENTYPYTGTNQASEQPLDMQNVSGFYDDRNVYPTQYCPPNVNNINVEGNTFNNYCENNMNQYWATNYNPYYTPQ